MKKIIAVISFIFIIQFVNAGTASSLGLANSYSLRADGVDALYWNPSNLYGYDLVVSYDFLSFSTQFSNNAFSISTYNKYNGKYLTIEDKEDIVNALSDNLNINGTGHFTLFGMAWNNRAFSLGMNFTADGELDQQFVDLLFNGNSDQYDSVYKFGLENNNFGGLSYADLTYGSSQHTLQEYIKPLKKLSYIPKIKIGYSLSLLAGLGNGEITEFDGTFSTDDEAGLALDQKVKLKYAIGGFGFKGNVGLSSEVYENVEVAMSFDNLVGFINWKGTTEEALFTVHEDSLFISELDDDIFSTQDSTYTIDSYETNLPTIFRFATMYTYNFIDVSLDWQKTLEESPYYSDAHIISIGSQVNYIPRVPLRFGIQFGNKDMDYKVSYGIGYNGKHYSLDLGIQSSGAFFTTDKSKGIAFALSNRLYF